MSSAGQIDAEHQAQSRPIDVRIVDLGDGLLLAGAAAIAAIGEAGHALGQHDADDAQLAEAACRRCGRPVIAERQIGVPDLGQSQAVLRLEAGSGAAAVGRTGMAVARQHPAMDGIKREPEHRAVRRFGKGTVGQRHDRSVAAAEAGIGDPIRPVDRHQAERVGERRRLFHAKPYAREQRAGSEAERGGAHRGTAGYARNNSRPRRAVTSLAKTASLSILMLRPSMTSRFSNGMASRWARWSTARPAASRAGRSSRGDAGEIGVEIEHGGGLYRDDQVASAD